MAFSFSPSNKVKMTTALFAFISVFLHLLLLKAPNFDFFSSENKSTNKPTPPLQVRQVSLRTQSRSPDIVAKNHQVSPRPKSQTHAPLTNLKKEKKSRLLADEMTPLNHVLDIPTIDLESAIISNEEHTQSDLRSEFSLHYPDSAELFYDVERIDKSNARVSGSAKLNWKINASHYSIKMELQATMLFTNVQLYSMQSEGELNHLGLRPSLATEKRFNRAQTATHFDSKANTILFSSSNQRVPMQGVAQDRSSLLIQLASAVKSDTTQFTPGRIFSIQVGEDRAAISYVFEVVGTEKISTKVGIFDALHLVRKPLSGSYQAQLDLWFAPELGGYPIQIRNTEGNGNITTQTLSQLQIFPSQES
jgi:hypothetical protein